MKHEYKIVTVFLLLILVGSILMNFYSQDKFEERYGRKPINVCEGSASIGMIPIGYCDQYVSEELRLGEKRTK